MQSDVVLVDVSAPVAREVRRLKGVGQKAHGLVSWRGSFLMLDSENGALQSVDPLTGDATRLWQVIPGP
jgi:hypothetical protein